MLPIMATAKKNFVAIRQKSDFSDRRENKPNSIRFSLSRARVPKLWVGTVRTYTSRHYKRKLTAKTIFQQRGIILTVLIHLVNNLLKFITWMLVLSKG
jgi:hypothetical protein